MVRFWNSLLFRIFIFYLTGACKHDILSACRRRELDKMLNSVLREHVNRFDTNAMNAIYSEQELNKDSQVSVRMENGLYKALEAQTEVWGFKNVSQTVRAILTFYFLPVAYEIELKNKNVSDFKKFLLEKQKEGYSLEQAKANYFVFQLVEYLQFLEQAKVMSNHSIKFMEKTTVRLNDILHEVQGKIETAMKEVLKEQEQGEK